MLTQSVFKLTSLSLSSGVVFVCGRVEVKKLHKTRVWTTKKLCSDRFPGMMFGIWDDDDVIRKMPCCVKHVQCCASLIRLGLAFPTAS